MSNGMGRVCVGLGLCAALACTAAPRDGKRSDSDRADAAADDERSTGDDVAKEVRPDVQRAINRVTGGSKSDRGAAVDDLRDLFVSEAHADEVTAVLTAAASMASKSGAVDAALLRTVRGRLSDVHPVQVYMRYPKFSDPGKQAALELLATLGTGLAAEGYAKAVRGYGWPSETTPEMTAGFVETAAMPLLLVPSMLGGAKNGIPEGVIDEFLYEYARRGAIPEVFFGRVQERVLARARPKLDFLAALPAEDLDAWRWSEAYAERRESAVVLVDTVGYLSIVRPSPELRDVLVEAQRLADPRLRLFALCGATNYGLFPEAELMRDIATDPETRVLAYRTLKTELLRDFPAEFSRPEKLAESDLVEWLIRTDGVGRLPDEIEFMNVVETDGGAGKGRDRYHVFRSRMLPPHPLAGRGWMAGVVGPTGDDGAPEEYPAGEPRSTLQPWDEFDVVKRLGPLANPP